MIGSLVEDMRCLSAFVEGGVGMRGAIDSEEPSTRCKDRNLTECGGELSRCEAGSDRL